METNLYGESRAPEQPRTKKAGARKSRAAWLKIAGLILLSLLPLTFGAIRLLQLTGGAEITPANARFFASPLPVTVHIVGAGVYALLGALQFSTGLRRRSPGWHRVTGRFVVVCGLLVALSALWMTLFYSRPPGTGDLLFALRLVFGSGMLLSILLGFAAIRRQDVAGRRDVSRHQAWMMRAYAIGLGAGTQMLTLMVGEIIAGPPDELSHALLMGAGWVINLAVAEWVIYRRRPARARSKTIVIARSR